MDFLAKARHVIEIETGALQRMAARLDEGFPRAVTMLHETLDRRGKIVVVGIGKSGNIGHKIAATLNSTGATAVVLNSQNALHGDLGILSDGDAVLLLSYSGETPELLDLLPQALQRGLYRVALERGFEEMAVMRGVVGPVWRLLERLAAAERAWTAWLGEKRDGSTGSKQREVRR